MGTQEPTLGRTRPSVLAMHFTRLHRVAATRRDGELVWCDQLCHIIGTEVPAGLARTFAAARFRSGVLAANADQDATHLTPPPVPTGLHPATIGWLRWATPTVRWAFHEDLQLAALLIAHGRDLPSAAAAAVDGEVAMRLSYLESLTPGRGRTATS